MASGNCEFQINRKLQVNYLTEWSEKQFNYMHKTNKILKFIFILFEIKINLSSKLTLDSLMFPIVQHHVCKEQ